MHVKVSLVKQSDVVKFVEACTGVEKDVYLTDGGGFCVSAKSLLGALYTMEWNTVYCDCETDIYNRIKTYVAEE